MKRTFFVALLMLAASSITLAIDSPNTPPASERKMKMPPPSGEIMGPGHERMAQGRAELRDRLAERHDEYIKWLEKNYPNEAKELSQIKETNPDLYLKRLKESFDKYGRLAHAEKTDPNMAKLLREDIELKTQEQKTLEQLRVATDESQKKKFTEELQNLAGKRFDIIATQKQLRYQALNKRLEEMKKDLQKQQADLDKLKSKKNEEVKKHVDGLINKTEQINW